MRDLWIGKKESDVGKRFWNFLLPIHDKFVFGDAAMLDLYHGIPLGRRQATIWTNAGMLLNGPLGTNLSKMLIKIQTF